MNWCVYLITNGSRTYIGSTTDVVRRLRQHNGELKGGARSTRGHRWEMICYLAGFENRSVACRWEKIIKSRGKGLTSRIYMMNQVAVGVCPGHPKRKEYQVPEGIILCA